MGIDFIQIILAISTYSAILPLGLGIFKWKNLSFELKILSAYLFLSLITDVTTLQLANNNKNNLYLLYAFTLPEFVLFSWIYFRIFSSLYLKRVILAVGILFFIIVIFSLYKEGASTYATVPRTVECVIFTIYSIIFYYKMLKATVNLRVEKDVMFWYNGGILVYFAGLLLFYSLSSYILENASLDLQKKLFATPAVLNIVQKLLFTIAIWVSPRKK